MISANSGVTSRRRKFCSGSVVEKEMGGKVEGCEDVILLSCTMECTQSCSLVLEAVVRKVSLRLPVSRSSRKVANREWSYGRNTASAFDAC